SLDHRTYGDELDGSEQDVGRGEGDRFGDSREVGSDARAARTVLREGEIASAKRRRRIRGRGAKQAGAIDLDHGVCRSVHRTLRRLLERSRLVGASEAEANPEDLPRPDEVLVEDVVGDDVEEHVARDADLVRDPVVATEPEVEQEADFAVHGGVRIDEGESEPAL